jgi:hypothetical protein
MTGGAGARMNALRPAREKAPSPCGTWNLWLRSLNALPLLLCLETKAGIAFTAPHFDATCSTRSTWWYLSHTHTAGNFPPCSVVLAEDEKHNSDGSFVARMIGRLLRFG